MNIVQEVKKFAEIKCRKPASKYGYEFFSFHLVPVAKYAGKLADELGGDKEVILIAAWLHDIGSVIYGRKDHHLTGAKVAEKKLRELKYPEEKIKLVKKCILNHRGSKPRFRHSLEEQIIVEADTLAAFESISGIFKAAFIHENLDQGEAKIAVRRKFKNKWKQLRFVSSKKMIRPKYEAAMILLA